MASSGDLLLNEKQKKPFVSLKDEVTIIHESLTTASLAQVDEALNGPESNLFCPDASSLRGWSIFFVHSVSLLLSKLPGYLFKTELHIEQKSANRFIFVPLKLNCRF